MTTYEELLIEAAPAIIETEAQYKTIKSRFGKLVGKGSARRSKEETRIMRLLGLLVADYDNRHSQSLPPDRSTPAETLQFLLEHSGKTPADLLPIFRQRSHVNEALNGKRAISVTRARKLGEMFHVSPALFI